MPSSRVFRAGAHTKKQQLSVDDIQWNNEQRSIQVGQTIIGLTPTEYRILFTLRHGTPANYLSMAWHVYQDRMMDEKARLTMDKHVERIRGKLRGTGIYLYCVLGYGYLLLPETITDEIEHPSSNKKGFQGENLLVSPY